MMIRETIGRKIARKKVYSMIMNTMRRWKSLRSGKNNLVFVENNLEGRMHRGCPNCVNRMDLRNNIGVASLEDIFHVMGTDDLRRINYETLEVIHLSLLLELHC
jgi:hypothetical protein